MSWLRNPDLIHSQPAREELHVAGLVVHSRPQQLAAAAGWLLAQDGVEVHAQSEGGKLMVVMESRRGRDILDLIDRARARPGILDAALIYHEIIEQDREEAG